jgi:hypothetical protein
VTSPRRVRPSAAAGALVACCMAHVGRLPLARVVALAAALSLLAACAPATVGDRSNPYRPGVDGAASARPGSTVFVRIDVARDVFGLTGDDLAMRLTPWGTNLSRATVTPLFDLRDVVAPDGWGVELDRVVAFLSGSRSTADVEATLRVDVPAGARLGGQRLRATLADERGNRHTIEFVVQVGP